ncbi:protein adenylyltransferase SelO family protein [Halopseudomonas pachastrellae]|nr:protein adenylyltransferase SelO family protein [Halopseudomonas pachastrellae]
MVCSEDALALLDLDSDQAADPLLVELFAGHKVWSDAEPRAMVYSGISFGAYNPQLWRRSRPAAGRGGQPGRRLLGSAPQGRRQHALLAHGRWPRGLRSSIREFLASEALHALGIPTSRALCVTVGDNPVYREREERAAMLLRLAPSHIRFGHFEYFYYTRQQDALRQLLEFTLDTCYPDCRNAEKPALAMLHQVLQCTAEMVARWQAYGFCHGVMNTDNMSILGITFDFGPYAFLDAFDARHICNHSDHEGRYAFHRQPLIAQWNLACLAQALTPFASVDELKAELANFMPLFEQHYLALMRQRLGWTATREDDAEQIDALLQLMQASGATTT